MTEENDLEDKLRKLLDNSSDKKLSVEYDLYGVCCTVVPSYKITVKNSAGVDHSSKALEFENAIDYLLAKLKL